ncbi:VirD4-like conjugal transfer protein, CD1115 family [Flavonifractor plautii]|uniref:VirD4-like conjugal transfer protein, CD1115 family n=1 Tax=Flavonifractor plautii TaxID=292800 RepID=UPI003A4A2296
MSRVSFYTRPYDRLEPYDGKLSRTVLRGGAGSNASLLPDIRNEKDVLTLIDNLIKNTTPRNASSNDPFWEKAEIALDSALMLYLVSEAPPEEQNFETMIYMMNFAEVREEDDQYRSPLDMLFRALEEEQPNHVAVKQFKAFKQAAGKTAKSILVSAAVRLAAFNIPQYAEMTKRDEMDFGSLGERKKAIFCVIPIADTSMNYLIGMLYTQCFQELYRCADDKYNGRLPVPVRVIQDEWANVAQPESYPKILATCRSYNIGLNIIVQNIQNIKALYEKEWESIIGNCDTLLFLGGGNEPTSLEFVTKLLGKETIDTRTRGQTKGRSGSSSTNFQQTGRELLTMDEVRKLDTKDAILFIRGEDPVLDQKYDLKRHPNIRLTADGKAKPYIHKPQGAPNYALPDLPYAFKSLDDFDFIDMEETEHEESEQEDPLEGNEDE